MISLTSTMIMCDTDMQSVFFVKGADIIEHTAGLF